MKPSSNQLPLPPPSALHHSHPQQHHHHAPNPYATSSSSSSFNNKTDQEESISFLRNSRAISVLWAVFTSCYAIINIVIFIQPQWLGDTESSRGTGYFGLWKSCRLIQDGSDLVCAGNLNDFSTIISPAFRAATVFVGASVILILICVCSFALFCFLPSSTVFHICGWIQAANGTSLLIGILIFPAGWDSSLIKEVCGNESDNYGSGQCSIRWAMILALISVLDVFVLSILAFVLGTKYSKLIPPTIIHSTSSVPAFMTSSPHHHHHSNHHHLHQGNTSTLQPTNFAAKNSTFMRF